MANTGLYVPLVMIPRFTTYIGQGTYTTAPLDVSAYSSFSLTVWRGPLVSGTGPGAGLNIVFQDSDDTEVWAQLAPTPIVSAGPASTAVSCPLIRRWMRLKLTLTENPTDHIVALTCWAIGNLELRERG